MTGRIDDERHPREDEFYSSQLRRQHGGGGSSRSGWNCLPTIAAILAAPWLLDLLLTGSRPLT